MIKVITNSGQVVAEFHSKAQAQLWLKDLKAKGPEVFEEWKRYADEFIDAEIDDLRIV